MLVWMFLVIIYLIYYITVCSEEPNEVVQKLSDCLKPTASVLVYKPHEFLDISLDSPKVTFQVFTDTLICF